LSFGVWLISLSILFSTSIHVVACIPFSAMQEAEIGGLQFEASPGKKLARHCIKSKLAVVVHTCNPNYSGSGGRRS
jgi:hypothetical protein